MQQPWSGLIVQFGGDRFMQEREEVSVLFLASRDHCPHPLVIALSRCAARALGDLSVDHAVPNLLLAVIVRWLDTFGEHETKIVLRQVIRFWLRRFLRRVLDNREPRSRILGLL